MSAEVPAADAVGSTTSAGASSQSAADLAKARREARKAKILGSGGDRLARITKTGRGEDAEAIYPSTPPVGASSGTGASTPLSARLPTDDPDDVDIAHFGGPAAAGFQGPSDQDMQGMMAEMFGGRMPLGGAQGSAGGMKTQMDQQPQDPLQQMMMAMQRQLGGDSGEPGEMPQLPFDLGAMLGGGGGGAGGLGGLFGGAQGGAPPPKSRLDKVFDLLHLIFMLVLGFITVSAVFTRSALEKSVTTTTLGGENLILADEAAGLQRWAKLGYERPGQWETQFFAIAERLPFQNVVSGFIAAFIKFQTPDILPAVCLGPLRVLGDHAAEYACLSRSAARAVSIFDQHNCSADPVSGCANDSANRRAMVVAAFRILRRPLDSNICTRLGHLMVRLEHWPPDCFGTIMT